MKKAVSKRRNAKNKQEEYALVKILLESLASGVVLFDMDDQARLTNAAFRKITGLPEKGFKLADVIKVLKNLPIDLKERMAYAAKHDKTISIDQLTIKNAFYQMNIVPVKHLQHKIHGIALVLQDITHIIEVDRMKTEFVSIASHQLRSPLTAVRLFIDMLVAEEVGPLNDLQKDYLDNIHHSTVNMIHLVNDLLNISRLESGRLRIDPHIVPLDTMIDYIIKSVEPLAEEKNCKIVFKKPKKPLPSINVDVNLIYQVIYNLITNALKYSLGKKASVEVTLKKEGSNYLISVKDQGIGIPKKVQSRIFGKFVRADNAIRAVSEGSGLGLYVAKMVIKASGGKIWFESKEDKGTTFYVSIPIKGMKSKLGEKGLDIDN